MKHSVLISGKFIEVNNHDFNLLKSLSNAGVKFTIKTPKKPRLAKVILFFALLGCTLGANAQQVKPKPTKQCIGLTTKGVQCKRKLPLTATAKYCFQHSPETDAKNKR